MKPLFECYREIIPGFSDFQESLRRPMPVHLRLNSLKVEPENLKKNFREKGINLTPSVPGEEALVLAPGLRSPGNLLEYALGHVHPQALTSCLAALALGPSEGASVLDVCAAPGGKTSHLAQVMNNTGVIVANELYTSRHIPLGHTLTRLGVLNTLLTGYQAQEFPLRQRFDFVLADVPCSGEGTFRVRGPAHRAHRKVIRSTPLPELQRKMILRAFDLLEEAGEMIYSTCTYDPEENESVVDFLLNHRDAELRTLNLPLTYQPGITEWRGHTYDKTLRRAGRFYPHQIDSVGFFLARIGRRRGT